MKYSFIEDHREQWPVSVQCSVRQVSRNGFHAWCSREESRTSRRRAELTKQIRHVHQSSRRTYGSPRIHAELMAQGYRCNRKTVARCMKHAGIQAKSHRKFRVTTTDSHHAHPVAKNIVNRDFQPSGRNQTWTADITYVATNEGWLYLAAVEDLFTREIVGWSMSEKIDSRLVVDALEMAISRQCPGEELIAHSDRGVQYASEHYQRLLKEHGITSSMSRKGNCYYNAPMESFFATLKKELVHHEQYRTRAEARASRFEYIEVLLQPDPQTLCLDLPNPSPVRRGRIDLTQRPPSVGNSTSSRTTLPNQNQRVSASPFSRHSFHGIDPEGRALSLNSWFARVLYIVNL